MSGGDNDFEWAVKNGDLDMVKTFLAKNKDAAGKPLSSGRNPLVMAADYGQKDVLEYLISSGANVNVVDSHGMTPLLAAIYEGHADCVKLLLEKGADKNQKAPNGDTYYDSAETDEIKTLLKK